MSELIGEATALTKQDPNILQGTDADLDAYALTQKALRQADAKWPADRHPSFRDEAHWPCQLSAPVALATPAVTRQRPNHHPVDWRISGSPRHLQTRQRCRFRNNRPLVDMSMPGMAISLRAALTASKAPQIAGSKSLSAWAMLSKRKATTGAVEPMELRTADDA
jgi:hypothetical protein